VIALVGGATGLIGDPSFKAQSVHCSVKPATHPKGSAVIRRVLSLEAKAQRRSS
jgi:tyrosyl-tRNA synthetase